MDGGGWHFYSVGSRPCTKVHCIEWVYTCVKENELVQNLTIYNSTQRPRSCASFFLKANQLPVAIQGVLWAQKNHSTTESGCGLVKSRCVLGNIDENNPHPCHFAVKSSLAFWMDVCTIYT